jgi:hypothetical protein
MSDHKRHETSMYAFGAMAPTQDMPAVTPRSPLTVRQVIAGIMEVDMEAWKCLPVTVKDMLLDSPGLFSFHEFRNTGGTNLVPDLIYAGVRVRWDEVSKRWNLYSIEKI